MILRDWCNTCAEKLWLCSACMCIKLKKKKQTHLYKCKLLAKDSHIYEYLVLPQFAATSGSVSLGKVHCFPDRQMIWYLVYRVPCTLTLYPGDLKKSSAGRLTLHDSARKTWSWIMNFIKILGRPVLFTICVFVFVCVLYSFYFFVSLGKVHCFPESQIIWSLNQTIFKRILISSSHGGRKNITIIYYRQ